MAPFTMNQEMDAGRKAARYIKDSACVAPEKTFFDRSTSNLYSKLAGEIVLVLCLPGGGER